MQISLVTQVAALPCFVVLYYNWESNNILLLHKKHEGGHKYSRWQVHRKSEVEIFIQKKDWTDNWI